MKDLEEYYYDNITSEDLEEMVDEDISIIANHITSIRKQRGMTQKELADSSGISLGSIIKIESGTHRNVTFQQIKRISVALNVSISKIIEIDFNSAQAEDINRFLLYYPLLRKDELYDVFGAVKLVTGNQDLAYLNKRLNDLYSSFPIEIRAFIELQLLNYTVGFIPRKNNSIKPYKYDIPKQYKGIFNDMSQFKWFQQIYDQIVLERANICRIVSDGITDFSKRGYTTKKTKSKFVNHNDDVDNNRNIN